MEKPQESPYLKCVRRYAQNFAVEALPPENMFLTADDNGILSYIINAALSEEGRLTYHDAPDVVNFVWIPTDLDIDKYNSILRAAQEKEMLYTAMDLVAYAAHTIGFDDAEELIEWAKTNWPANRREKAKEKTL